MNACRCVLMVLLASPLAIAASRATSAQLSAVTSSLDIPYKVALDSDLQRLDVFAPSGAKNLPVLLFVHGGGWAVSDRRDYREWARTFAKDGVVAVVPSFRLWPNANASDEANDVADAVAWTHRNIALFGGRGDHLVIVGHSSGAHLAALVALDHSYVAKRSVDDRYLSGAVVVSGVYDVRAYGNASDAESLFGKSAEDRRRLSPLAFASSSSPAFEIICGDREDTATCDRGRALDATLKSAAVSSDFFIEANADHMGAIWKAADLTDRLHQRIVDFVLHHER